MLELSKFRLGSLVVFTTMSGYCMAPVPFEIIPFLICSVGTIFSVGSANSINQVMEIANDAKMRRTQNRVLPHKLITPLQALSFGILSGVLGIYILYIWVNPLSALLSLSTIILYTLIYTPLKQISPINTWIGSVVGAIPPLIGWAAVMNDLGSGALVIGTLLYLWQIPHFMALSWNLAQDYKIGGYKMLANTAPEKVSGTALRYTIYMLPIGYLSYLSGMTTWWFAVDSLFVNAYLLYYAMKFYKETTSENARNLFFASIKHLPILLLLMFIHKADYNISNTILELIQQLQ